MKMNENCLKNERGGLCCTFRVLLWQHSPFTEYREKCWIRSKILDSLMAWLGEKKKDRIQLNSS